MTFIKKNCGGILLCAIIAAFAEIMCMFGIGGFSFELIGVPVFAIITGMIISLISPTLAGGLGWCQNNPATA